MPGGTVQEFWPVEKLTTPGVVVVDVVVVVGGSVVVVDVVVVVVGGHASAVRNRFKNGRANGNADIKLRIVEQAAAIDRSDAGLVAALGRAAAPLATTVSWRLTNKASAAATSFAC